MVCEEETTHPFDAIVGIGPVESSCALRARASFKAKKRSAAGGSRGQALAASVALYRALGRGKAADAD